MAERTGASVPPRGVGWRLWLLWVLASSLGWTVGGVVIVPAFFITGMVLAATGTGAT